MKRYCARLPIYIRRLYDDKALRQVAIKSIFAQWNRQDEITRLFRPLLIQRKTMQTYNSQWSLSTC